MKNKTNVKKTDIGASVTIVEKSKLNTFSGGLVVHPQRYSNPDNMDYETYLIVEIVYQPIEVVWN